METKGIFGFKLDEVKGKDAYIENALEKELAYLKSFDADRLVAGFREVNKLRPKSEKYQGSYRNPRSFPGSLPDSSSTGGSTDRRCGIERKAGLYRG